MRAGCGSYKRLGPEALVDAQPRQAVPASRKPSAPRSPPARRADTPLSSTSTPWSTSVSWTSAVRFGWSMPAQQLPQRRDQGEQLGPQDVAFAHVDDAVRLGGIEADRPRPARPSAPAASLGGGCSAATDAARGFRSRARAAPARLDPRDADSRDRPRRRHAGAGSRRIREMPAWRLLVMRARTPARRRRAARRRARRTATWRPLARHAVAARRDADDRLVHSDAMRVRESPRRGRRRSSAARRSRRRGRAARRRRRPLRTPACPAPAAPRSSRRARRRSRRSPARPAPAARSRAGRRARRPACPGPCRRRPRRDRRAASSARSGFGPGNLAEQLARIRPRAA